MPTSKQAIGLHQLTREGALKFLEWATELVSDYVADEDEASGNSGRRLDGRERQRLADLVAKHRTFEAEEADGAILGKHEYGSVVTQGSLLRHKLRIGIRKVFKEPAATNSDARVDVFRRLGFELSEAEETLIRDFRQPAKGAPNAKAHLILVEEFYSLRFPDKDARPSVKVSTQEKQSAFLGHYADLSMFEQFSPDAGRRWKHQADLLRFFVAQLLEAPEQADQIVTAFMDPSMCLILGGIPGFDEGYEPGCCPLCRQTPVEP